MYIYIYIIFPGIGYMTTRDLMKMGARVILACRSPSKAEDVGIYVVMGL